jgi:hypothetical protein
MTGTIDTECMILIAMLKRDAESLKKVSEAAADAVLAVYRTAVPLAKYEESLEAMLEGLNQAMDKSLELTKALRSLSRRVEKDEISGHELAEILARKHYLDRRGYTSWTFALPVAKNDSVVGE